MRILDVCKSWLQQRLCEVFPLDLVANPVKVREAGGPASALIEPQMWMG